MIDYKNVQPLDDFNWDEFESGSRLAMAKAN